MKKDYMGDGVYATWDGYSVILILEAQDDSRIVLEPEVLAAVMQFYRRVSA